MWSLSWHWQGWHHPPAPLGDRSGRQRPSPLPPTRASWRGSSPEAPAMGAAGRAGGRRRQGSRLSRPVPRGVRRAAAGAQAGLQQAWAGPWLPKRSVHVHVPSHPLAPGGLAFPPCNLCLFPIPPPACCPVGAHARTQPVLLASGVPCMVVACPVTRQAWCTPRACCDDLLHPRQPTGPLAERSPAPPPAPADCPLAAGQLLLARRVPCFQPGPPPPGSHQLAGAQRPL